MAAVVVHEHGHDDEDGLQSSSFCGVSVLTMLPRIIHMFGDERDRRQSLWEVNPVSISCAILFCT